MTQNCNDTKFDIGVLQCHTHVKYAMHGYRVGANIQRGHHFLEWLWVSPSSSVQCTWRRQQVSVFTRISWSHLSAPEDSSVWQRSIGSTSWIPIRSQWDWGQDLKLVFSTNWCSSLECTHDPIRGHSFLSRIENLIHLFVITCWCCHQVRGWPQLCGR